MHDTYLKKKKKRNNETSTRKIYRKARVDVGRKNGEPLQEDRTERMTHTSGGEQRERIQEMSWSKTQRACS